jgi:hypothetical protein
VLKKLSFSRDIWGCAGARETFVEVVGRIPMVEGGAVGVVGGQADATPKSHEVP